MARFLSIPIGFKIFGAATSMLTLLIGVAYINHSRIAQVNDELSDIAHYLTRLSKLVTEVNVHVLDQDIYFERVLRLYETEPLDLKQIEQEQKKFEEPGLQIDQVINKAIKLSEDAIETADNNDDIKEFSRLAPLLEQLENDHQKLYDRSLVIFNLLKKGKREEAELLHDQLEDYEEDLNQHSQHILSELKNFNENSTRRAQKNQQETIRISWFLAGIASGVGIFFSSIITLGITRPVKRLVKGTQAVEQGDLDAQVTIISGDEIGILSKSFNLMLDNIRKKEQIKATFGQYVDPRIVERLINQKKSNTTTNKQVMTVFFSDIAGFSAISEMLTPGGLVKLINQYLTLASEPIAQNNGVINQFLGDAVSAFWGHPFVSENDHAKLACYAALEQSNQLNKLRRMMPEIMGFRKGLPEIKVRMGLATGELVTGNIGSEHSKSYTVMGKAVQIAEQLEGMNKIYGTTILLMEETKILAAEAIETREIDRLYLGDRNEPVGVYELLSYAGELDPKFAEWRDCFEAGLREYRQQNWDQAQSDFQACLHLNADDKATLLYLQRMEFLRHNPPPQDWHGVWETLL